MSNARCFIYNPLRLRDNEVTHAMDVEVRDIECNRTSMTLLLPKSHETLTINELENHIPWKIKAWSDAYPFTWDYPEAA